MRQFVLFLISVFTLISVSSAQEVLTITIDDRQTTYTPESLFKHPNLVIVKQVHLPTYPGQSFDLKAIPLCNLLNINDKTVGSILKIRASDKYVSYFNLHRIHPCDKTRASTAYIAIEDPNKPWPIVSKLKRSAGPFYLIWQGEKVSQTDWIFGTEAISTTTHNPFSTLLPANSTGQEAKGLEIFSSKCGVCHSINLVGNLELGPDLNFPMNPTEYFSEALLRQFIRNPQSVRFLKNDKMFPFSEKLLPNEELDAIIAFLKLMRAYKIQTVPKNLLSSNDSMESFK
ncbi:MULTISPECIES: c-type cytochrome [Legionella]|uniref:Putative signal peptide protein n=1 Tax=Legionella maceachernii TaxID=466 RepID=A0A0W0W489_9GAMM|nr:cytochrome c [Legionella maceachernii]KTD27146.1 putative signal peptide protein [Legionella maceachernii]SKA14043.1 Cytochrome c, mono-and diheme variants [Legionella maceachernii]SUP04848.1 Uncharacterised protein [Legionella maceachernii]